MMREAYEAEGSIDHLVVNRRGGGKDKAKKAAATQLRDGGDGVVRAGGRRGGRTRELPECTACRNPFYEDVAVHEHSILGVAVCLYCLQEAAAASAADDEPPAAVGEGEGEAGTAAADAAASDSSDVCMWCAGNSPAAESGNLLLCDGMLPSDADPSVCRPCGKAVCEGCVRLNLGEDALETIRKTDPWLCFSCDRSALAPLREACAAERRAGGSSGGARPTSARRGSGLGSGSRSPRRRREVGQRGGGERRGGGEEGGGGKEGGGGAPAAPLRPPPPRPPPRPPPPPRLQEWAPPRLEALARPFRRIRRATSCFGPRWCVALTWDDARARRRCPKRSRPRSAWRPSSRLS